MKKYILFILIGFFLATCQDETTLIPKDEVSSFLKLPPGYPVPDIPEDNAFSKARIELGRKLFYDPVLSRDSSLSCSSCHKQEFAFADNTPTNPGIEDRPGVRNPISLGNVAYQPRQMREGGVPTLEMQILVPIQEHNEFDFNMVLLIQRLNKIPEYVELSKKAYDRLPDAFVITRAISAFERIMISANSPYDQYSYLNKEDAMSPAAKRGMALFSSDRLACMECHSGHLLTTFDFENNGLYEHYRDSGRIHFTAVDTDRGKFKIPSLKNIAVTAPYMHDGSLASLNEVLDHYSSGGKAHPNKSPKIKSFTLSESERADLIRFFESLTDEEFLNRIDLTEKGEL